MEVRKIAAVVLLLLCAVEAMSVLEAKGKAAKKSGKKDKKEKKKKKHRMVLKGVKPWDKGPQKGSKPTVEVNPLSEKELIIMSRNIQKEIDKNDVAVTPALRLTSACCC